MQNVQKQILLQLIVQLVVLNIPFCIFFTKDVVAIFSRKVIKICRIIKIKLPFRVNHQMPKYDNDERS